MSCGYKECVAITWWLLSLRENFVFVNSSTNLTLPEKAEYSINMSIDPIKSMIGNIMLHSEVLSTKNRTNRDKLDDILVQKALKIIRIGIHSIAKMALTSIF